MNESARNNEIKHPAALDAALALAVLNIIGYVGTAGIIHLAGARLLADRLGGSLSDWALALLVGPAVVSLVMASVVYGRAHLSDCEGGETHE